MVKILKVLGAGGSNCSLTVQATIKRLHGSTSCSELLVVHYIACTDKASHHFPTALWCLYHFVRTDKASREFLADKLRLHSSSGLCPKVSLASLIRSSCFHQIPNIFMTTFLHSHHYRRLLHLTWL
jgi:hypothetical protein